LRRIDIQRTTQPDVWDGRARPEPDDGREGPMTWLAILGLGLVACSVMASRDPLAEG
jgi:hypothetical protein